MTGADTGLLSPVRAGTPVEAAVSDEAWLRAVLDAEAALVRAQARCGTVPPDAAALITKVVDASRFDVRAIALASRETANPVVALVGALTREVAAHDPAAADYVHRGSTSQDVFDTGAMLVAARALLLTLADLDDVTDALDRLAAEHRATPMAGRTLGLHAVPTTFGLKAAGWRQVIGDAHRRLSDVLAHGLPVSLGGAAGTLAGYLEYAGIDGHISDPDAYAAELTETFADETGLAVPRLPWHSIRTPIADLAAALGFAAGALGRFAVDVQSLARTEVGEVSEPSVSGRGASSAMPQKRNPVLSTMIRAASAQVPALAGALTQCLVTEDERSAGVWHTEWLLLRECLRLVGGAASTAVELATGLEVHPGRMLANLGLTDGQIVTERIVARLSPLFGKAEAKTLVTKACLRAASTGLPVGAVLAADDDVRQRCTEQDLAGLTDPAAYLGAAPGLVGRTPSG
ncbi:class-II fumarase/aspartase family protein [Lentzea sp. NPDC055074]